MAALYPLLELLQVNARQHRLVLLRPISVIINKVSCFSSVSLIETQHNLVFVKRAVLVILVNHKHLATIPPVNIIREEHIYMVAVYTFRATNIAIGVLHGRFPFVALCIYSTTNGSFRVLNGDIECTNLHMTFLIIAGFFLFLRRSSIGFFLCHCNGIG